MRTIKRVFTIVAMAASLSVFALTEMVNGITWTYTVANGEASVGGGLSSATAVKESTAGAITIPSTLDSYPVTSIGSSAFFNCTNLTSVAIPDGVTSIGDHAFIGCRGLTNVAIPYSVTNIGKGAFYYCMKLKEVTIPEDVMSIEDDTFNGCSFLERIMIPDGVKNIGNDAFYGCSGLRNIILPVSVTNIGFRAFCYCRGLTHITIPNGVTSIKWKTFDDCSRLTSVMIPNSVTSIGEDAFRDCSGLSVVSIPNCVTNIDASAFRSCNGLTSIVIPDKVTSIGNEAFYACRSLNRVILSSPAINFGSGVFSNCVSLQTFTYPQNMLLPNAIFGKNAPDFIKCAYSLVATPDGNVLTVDSAPYGAFEDFVKTGKQVSSVVIQSGAASIGERAFYGLREMKTVSIPDTVTTINAQAFGYCSNLTNVTIPSSVRSVGNDAFYGCSRVAAIALGNSVINIGDCAFHSCTNLTSITIPNNVRRIGNDAFYGCSGLTAVRLGCGVTNIGIRAFSNCTQLELFTVDIDNSAYTANAGMLFTRDGNTLVSVPSGMKYVTLPENMTSIGTYAFCGCAGINSLSIPNSVTNIGVGAFIGCDSILDISMPARLLYCRNEGIALSKISISKVSSIPNSYTHDEVICDSDGSFAIDIELSGPQTISFDWKFATSRDDEYISWALDGLQQAQIKSNANSDYFWNSVYNTWFSKTAEIPNGNHKIRIVFSKKDIYETGSASARIKLKNIASLFPDSYGTVEQIRFTDDVTEIPYKTFAGCASLVAVQLPNTITNIGDRAFRDCASISNIIIPDAVQSIGNIFEGCNGLEHVNLPTGLIHIGEDAFKGCRNLVNISIPNNVTDIGVSAFSGCNSLTDVTIPNSVTNIGDSAFYGCSNLTCMVISDNVMRIGERAFNGCYSLTNFIVGADNPVYTSQDGLVLSKDGKILICGINGDVTIPETVTDIGNYAFSGFSGLTNVTIPESVTTIGPFAFLGCSGLTSISIPNSVTNIFWSGGVGAYTSFYLCEGLKTARVSSYVLSKQFSRIFPDSYKTIENIVIADNVARIPSESFRDCGNLKSIVFEGDAPEVGSFAFLGVASDCCIYVHQLSSGWGVSIPGKWENMDIDYIDSVVTFNANGGVGGVTSMQNRGAIVIVPTVTKIGYTFKCWSPNVDDIVPASNVTYMAQWTPNKYLVTFDANGGTGDYSKEQDFDTHIDAPVVTRDGYTFDRWLPNVDDMVPASNVTYTAQWTPNKYHVTFDANGGMGGWNREMYYDTSITAPTVRRAGYTFNGWSPSVDDTVPASNVTYTAQWEINQYMVTFDASGGAGGISGKQDYGTAIIAPTVTRTGYTFKGWSPSVAATVPANDVTYTAQWEINKYTLTFDANGGTYGTATTIVDYGTTVGELPVPTRTNATFLGWFTAAEGGSLIDGSTVITEAMTLYAQWLLLEEALDGGEGMVVKTSGNVPWFPLLDSDAKVGDAAARSCEIGDRTNTWLSATVEGAGTMTFWCKVSCEHDDDNTFTWDRLMVYTNDIEITEWRMDGETGWTQRSLSFDGGTNVVKWVYFKDRSVSEGEDCAWVDGVTWTLADVAVDVGGGKSVLVPMDWIDAHSNIVAAVGGDKSAAMKVTAANGRKVWECYVLGLDPEKTSDFKITSFPMKSDGTPDLNAITFEPEQNQWNLSGAVPKLKGKATLDAEWQDVPPGGNPSFRFFTVEVQMP